MLTSLLSFNRNKAVSHPTVDRRSLRVGSATQKLLLRSHPVAPGSAVTRRTPGPSRSPRHCDGANLPSHPSHPQVRTTRRTKAAASGRIPEVQGCDACDALRTRFAPTGRFGQAPRRPAARRDPGAIRGGRPKDPAHRRADALCFRVRWADRAMLACARAWRARAAGGAACRAGGSSNRPGQSRCG